MMSIVFISPNLPDDSKIVDTYNSETPLAYKLLFLTHPLLLIDDVLYERPPFLFKPFQPKLELCEELTKVRVPSTQKSWCHQTSKATIDTVKDMSNVQIVLGIGI